MLDKNDGCEHEILKGTTERHKMELRGRTHGYLYSSYHSFLGNKLILACILPLYCNQVNVVTVQK